MASALKGKPDVPYAVPAGIQSIKIDPLTGTRVGENEGGLYEYFYHEFPPPEAEPVFTPIPGFPGSPGAPVPGPTPNSGEGREGRDGEPDSTFTPIPGHSSKAVQPDQLF
jgi:penicillin-binding protein 1A